MSGVFPWYHGSISRDEEEARLVQAAQGLPSDTAIFLVRAKTGSDRDYVLTWMQTGPQLITRFLIKMFGGGNDVTFFLDAKTEKKTRYFRGINQLVDHFMQPDQGFPSVSGKLDLPVAAPTPVSLPEGMYSFVVVTPATPGTGTLRPRPNLSSTSSGGDVPPPLPSTLPPPSRGSAPASMPTSPGGEAAPPPLPPRGRNF